MLVYVEGGIGWTRPSAGETEWGTGMHWIVAKWLIGLQCHKILPLSNCR